MRFQHLISGTIGAAVLAGALVAPAAAGAAQGDGRLGYGNLGASETFGNSMMMANTTLDRGGAVRVASYDNDPWTYDVVPGENWLHVAEGGGWLAIRNTGTPGMLALAVPNARKDAGAPVILWTYEKGHYEQQWGLTHLPGDDLGYYHIKNRNSGLCLAVPNADPGAKLVQWPCVAGHAEQEWAREDR